MTNSLTFLFILLFLPLFLSCGQIKQVSLEHQVITTYKDSTIINIIDSIRYIPRERVVDVISPYDTLNLETSLAKAKAYVDTTNHLLKGEIENKKDFEQKHTIEYKEKITRDTTYIKQPVPYPVETIKYKHYWYESILWIISIISLIYFGLKFWILK